MSDSSHSVFISFGSNRGERFDTIFKALFALKKTPGISIIDISSLYETEPVGYTNQPDFINGVVRIETDTDPYELLRKTQKIEHKLGRQRDVRWGPRTIDLDILLFDDQTIDSAELVIPHQEIKNRRFVLEPLAEIAGDMIFPNSSKCIMQLLAETTDTSQIRLVCSGIAVEQKLKEG